MEARVLDAMRAYKRKIEDKALQARCVSRVNKMRAIVDKYRQTLHPHDFCLWREGVWWIPAIRKAITDGTDEEFNAWAAEVDSRLPQPTSQQWYRLRKALGTWEVRRALLLLLKNLHGNPTTSDVYTSVLENPSRRDIRGERSFVPGYNGLVLEVDWFLPCISSALSK